MSWVVFGEFLPAFDVTVYVGKEKNSMQLDTEIIAKLLHFCD